MSSCQPILRCRARWLALACVVGSALALGASGSALAGQTSGSQAVAAKNPNPTCPLDHVCLFSDKDWEGNRAEYACARGDRGTRTFSLVTEFPRGTRDTDAASPHMSSPPGS